MLTKQIYRIAVLICLLGLLVSSGAAMAAGPGTASPGSASVDERSNRSAPDLWVWHEFLAMLRQNLPITLGWLGFGPDRGMLPAPVDQTYVPGGDDPSGPWP